MQMKHIWSAFLALLWVFPVGHAAAASDGARQTLPTEKLPKVMSLNLCADPYLMGFAAREQLVALTPQSRDPALSAFVAAAKNFPVSDGRIETIAALKPDIVIVSSYSDPLRNRLVEKLGIEVLTLDAANSYAAARDEIMRLGAAIGRQAQAQAYLKKLDAGLQAARKTPSRRAEILPLQRRNLTAGEGHITDEIIALAGGDNIGRDTTNRLMGRISLESALAAKADFILLNETGQRPDSRGMEFLTHLALARAYPPQRRLSLPNNLLVCAGATTPLAVRRLADQLAGQLAEQLDTAIRD